jgi:hypothetical protein
MKEFKKKKNLERNKKKARKEIIGKRNIQRVKIQLEK